MGGLDGWDRLILVGAVLLVAACPAYAYIDPGSASVVWTAVMAPIVAALAWLGRRFVRLFARSKREEGGDGGSEESPSE